MPLAVLTDGREWNFYLPAQQGSYSERRAYQLVLDERDVGESIRRLRRYLQQDRLASGEALEAAIHDYKDARSRRESMDTMPKAWSELLAEPDPVLAGLILERTEALCGFRPSQEQAEAFLKGKAPADAVAPPRREPRNVSRPFETSTRETSAETDMGGRRSHLWTVGDKSGTAMRAVDAFVDYLDALFAAAPDRRSQIMASARTRSRNNIAIELADVYPEQPGIASKANRRLANGLFVGTNLSNASKVQLAKQAAMAAGLAFGSEARLDLSD